MSKAWFAMVKLTRIEYSHLRMSGDIEKLHLRDQGVDVTSVIDERIQQVIACVGAINTV